MKKQEVCYFLRSVWGGGIKMEIMTSDDVGYLLLAEDMDAINAGYYYKFEREADGTISLYSHTPSFCEKVPFSNICDYFRKPVYRRTSHV